MALSAGNKALWSDIQNIYTTLRTIQSDHGLIQTAIPSNPGQMNTTALSDLKNSVNGIMSEGHMSSAGITSVTATLPSRGSQIRADFLTAVRATVDAASAVCHFDNFRSFNGGFQSFGFGFYENLCSQFGN